ncbi:hypothetical protein V8F06_009446 [Rhypophila decipiens]
MVSLRYLITVALAVVTLSCRPSHLIRTLTAKSQALQAPAQSTTIVNGPLIIVGLGPFPQIISIFRDIVSTGTTFITQMSGSPSVRDEDEASSIADAWKEFVRVHQVLLNILIGKAGLFNTVPFIGQPVAAVLHQVESIVDTIAFGLIDTIEVGLQKQRVQNDANSLSSSLTICINAYEGPAVNNKAAKSP